MKKNTRAFVQLPEGRKKRKNWFIRIISSFWFWLVVVFVIIGALNDIPAAYNHYINPQQKQIHDEKIITGVLLPKHIDRTLPITIRLGESGSAFVYSIAELSSGVKLDLKYVTCDVMTYPELPIQMGLQIMDNRVYVTDTITYLENNEIIGVINNNQWGLFKDNLLAYYPNDEILEVIDRQNHVALSLYFVSSNIIQLQGYWNNVHNVTVVGDSFYPCISKDTIVYKTIAAEHLKKIKPMRLSPFNKIGLLYQ